MLLFFSGQEFEDLYVSTTEPVDDVGNTINPTKSPCDPYVFSSVLTRSKSLVVVVGCPEALLKIEEHMVMLYGNRAHCWSSYMKHCMKNATFSVPPEVEGDVTKRIAYTSELRKKLLEMAQK